MVLKFVLYSGSFGSGGNGGGCSVFCGGTS